MANTYMKLEEISPEENKSRYISEQPIDRHGIEITDKHITVFINGGIDSTCGKERAKIIHTLTNGIFISTNTVNGNSNSMTNLIDESNLQSPAELESNEASTATAESNSSDVQCCFHCGK